MAKPALKIVDKVEEAPPVHGDGDDGGVFWDENRAEAMQLALAIYHAKCSMYAASQQLCDDDPVELAGRVLGFILVNQT